MKKIALLAMILTGCGEYLRPTDLSKVVSVDPFSAYLDLFVEEAARHNKIVTIDNLIIKFGPLESDGDRTRLGLCTIGTTTPTITINPTTWQTLSAFSRVLLVAHEAGHCVLGRGHNDKEVSIMNSSLLSPTVFTTNEELFWNELFHPNSEDSMWSLMADFKFLD